MYPENTLAAVNGSADHVDAVEIDVVRCGSGELVVFHDENLERVTGYDGAVGRTSWERIRTLTVFDSGEPVPRLASVVEAWPSGLAVNLDVHRTGVAPDAIAAFEPLDERILLSSTSPAVLREVQPRPTLQLGLSFHREPGENVELAGRLGCEFVHVHSGLALETDVIERAHENGLSVDVWTLDDRATVERLAQRGADAVTVDRWDVVP